MKPQFAYSIAVLSALSIQIAAQAQDSPETISPLQSTLNQASEAGKFTFIVFYRQDAAPARTMYQAALDGAAARTEQAVATVSHVDDPAEQVLVARFGISRAPMPMTVVVAPNGAVTGLFPRALSDAQLTAAIVSPTMMQCMKDLQDQKLVFVCMTRTEECEVPQGVQGLQQDPHFSERVSLVALRLDNPNENQLYQQLQIDPQQINGPYAALIAPPGVLIGHFDSRATAGQIGAAIHAAGRCCDDPNCRHNQTRPMTNPPAPR